MDEIDSKECIVVYENMVAADHTASPSSSAAPSVDLKSPIGAVDGSAPTSHNRVAATALPCFSQQLSCEQVFQPVFSMQTPQTYKVLDRTELTSTAASHLGANCRSQQQQQQDFLNGISRRMQQSMCNGVAGKCTPTLNGMLSPTSVSPFPSCSPVGRLPNPKMYGCANSMQIKNSPVGSRMMPCSSPTAVDHFRFPRHPAAYPSCSGVPGPMMTSSPVRSSSSLKNRMLNHKIDFPSISSGSGSVVNGTALAPPNNSCGGVAAASGAVWCILCTTSINVDYFQLHVREHFQCGKYRCMICNVAFPSYDGFMHHCTMLTNHSLDQFDVCNDTELLALCQLYEDFCKQNTKGDNIAVYGLRMKLYGQLQKLKHFGMNPTVRSTLSRLECLLMSPMPPKVKPVDANVTQSLFMPQFNRTAHRFPPNFEETMMYTIYLNQQMSKQHGNSNSCSTPPKKRQMGIVAPALQPQPPPTTHPVAFPENGFTALPLLLSCNNVGKSSVSTNRDVVEPLELSPKIIHTVGHLPNNINNSRRSGVVGTSPTASNVNNSINKSALLEQQLLLPHSFSGKSPTGSVGVGGKQTKQQQSDNNDDLVVDLSTKVVGKELHNSEQKPVGSNADVVEGKNGGVNATTTTQQTSPFFDKMKQLLRKVDLSGLRNAATTAPPNGPSTSTAAVDAIPVMTTTKSVDLQRSASDCSDAVEGADRQSTHRRLVFGGGSNKHSHNISCSTTTTAVPLAAGCSSRAAVAARVELGEERGDDDDVDLVDDDGNWSDDSTDYDSIIGDDDDRADSAHDDNVFLVGLSGDEDSNVAVADSQSERADDVSSCMQDSSMELDAGAATAAAELPVPLQPQQQLQNLGVIFGSSNNISCGSLKGKRKKQATQDYSKRKRKRKSKNSDRAKCRICTRNLRVGHIGAAECHIWSHCLEIYGIKQFQCKLCKPVQTFTLRETAQRHSILTHDSKTFDGCIENRRQQFVGQFIQYWLACFGDERPMPAWVNECPGVKVDEDVDDDGGVDESESGGRKTAASSSSPTSVSASASLTKPVSIMLKRLAPESYAVSKRGGKKGKVGQGGGKQSS